MSGVHPHSFSHLAALSTRPLTLKKFNYLSKVNNVTPSLEKLYTEDPISVSQIRSQIPQSVLMKGEELGTVDHIYCKQKS